MDIETINPYIIRILVSAREADSISSISKRIGLSYGWTHKWIQELIHEGVFKERWKGVILQKNHQFYREMLEFVRQNVSKVSFYYSALTLFGIQYCFTKTDAVYFWTEGRYNIARYKEFYPIFIKIKKEDYPVFLDYCKRLKLKIHAKKGVFYVPEIVKDFACIKKGEYFVQPLDETIHFMKEHIYNFEPALEMIDEMYHKNLGITYKEASRL